MGYNVFVTLMCLSGHRNEWGLARASLPGCSPHNDPLTFPRGEDDSIGFDGSVTGFKPTELDLDRIVTDRRNIGRFVWRRGV